VKSAWVLALFYLVLTASDARAIRERVVSTSEALEAVLSTPADSLTVRLAPGAYHLSGTYRTEPTCGNCQDPGRNVFFSVGLQVSGKAVTITGPEDGAAVLHTHAGYGVLFTDCQDCSIRNLSVTGGTRDEDPNATDAAIVVKNSQVTIDGCRIYDNLGDSATVIKNTVGIMGICGREGATMTVTNNRITGNSWDGIALYRGAQASIADNLIDGVAQAHGSRIGGGRGVGIGVTWDAKAVIERNLIRRYWKGVGLFVDADGTVRGNVIEDILTWGIALWDADKGAPVGRIEDNVIFNTGACGVSITRSKPGEAPGQLSGNVIVGTGRNPAYDSPESYCFQCAIARHAVPNNFEIKDNVCYNNRRATNDLPDEDIPKVKFRRAVIPTCERLSASELLKQSAFYTTFCEENRSHNLID
jgi:hypothetical protein